VSRAGDDPELLWVRSGREEAARLLECRVGVFRAGDHQQRGLDLADPRDGLEGATRETQARSELRAEGWRVVEEVLAAAAEFSDTTVRVVAHTDTSGPVDYNQALSERRANAVVGALIEGGLLRSRITSEAVGQNQPLVDTGDGVREQANRVAEIDLL